MKHLGTKTIETDRMILRKFNMTDVEDMYNNWANDDDVTRFITWPSHKNIEETKKVVSNFIEEYTNADCYQWCIEYKETNEAVGSIAVVHMNEGIEAVEVGYCIGKAFWNKNITTEAMHAVMEFLFEEVGVNRIEAKHDTKNPASGKVMSKCGLKPEGIMRQGGKNNTGICDTAVYAMLKEDWDKLS